MRLPITSFFLAPILVTAAVFDLALNGNKPGLTRAIQGAVDHDEQEKGPRPGEARFSSDMRGGKASGG